MRHKSSRPFSFLLLVALLASLFAACGATNTPAVAPTTAASQPTTTMTVSAANTTAANATTAPVAATVAPSTTAAKQPQGELRIGTGFAPSALDVTKASNGYSLTEYGAAETLMRFNTQQKLEPWLAESVTNQDATTWQVKLRKGVKFHDGSEMKAADVMQSFRLNWEGLPSATNFISKETQIAVVDDYTLTFKTPKPTGDFSYNAASWNFVIHKPGTSASILTGPYKPVKVEKDQEIVLEAFADYWGGVPPLKTIRFKTVVDANARLLALQSGDLDFLMNITPELAKNLPAEFEKSSVPSTRLHQIILNHTKAPFNDKAVREATSLAIDRDTLNKATLDGQGGIATNIIPSNVGFDVVAAQKTDAARAKQLLDEAGWKAGAEGKRAKDGKALAFTLYSYPSRPELTQMAVGIQSQLKAVGYDVKVQEVRDITAQIKDGDFEAAMWSLNMAGDPQYLYGVGLVKGGAFNYGGYFNQQIETLYEQLRAEADSTKRQDLSRQFQEIVKADTPNIYIVAPPLINAFKKGAVNGYTPHPNDLYLINRNISLQK